MANNKIAYGIAKANGIDTSGMKPKQVWAALDKKGLNISKDSESEELKDFFDKEKREPKVEEFFESKKVPDVGEFFKNKKDEDGVRINKSSLKEFKEKLALAKASVSETARWRVDGTYSEEDYANADLFVTKNGSTVAVKGGDIISVCRNSNDEEVRGSELLSYAVEKGGNRLDAFGADLYKFYTRNGFEAISWNPFDKKFAPNDWNEKIAGEEPVIFYKYTGKKSERKYEDFLKEVKPSNDYDTAKQIRDKEIKK